MRTSPNDRRRLGMTIVEILVVVGVIVTLAGILLAALASVKSSGEMTKSMSNLRQIGIWVSSYASDNRETIVPSQFDYSYPNCPDCYKGKVRSAAGPATGVQHQGTWTDILWSVYEVGSFPGATASLNQDYRYDSPDDPLYELLPDVRSPFRSSALNKSGVFGNTPAEEPLPFGNGANRIGEQGYFAANDFFNARPDAPGTNIPPSGQWFVTGQIRFPDRSMYVVDSFAGEVIAPEEDPFQIDPATGDPPGTIPPGEVDFRYAEDFCLMQFLDGHVSPENKWVDLADLQDNRKIRVQDLNRNPS